jgi:hypothetical protein
MIKIDFKKQNKDLYAPKNEPSIIQVPTMNFIMVDGYGNPNDTEGEYHKAIELLYALSYTIKMANKNNSDEDNYDYVVAPLEGLWWLADETDRNFTQKDKFCWTSMIRQPEFVTEEIFALAKATVKKKKPTMEVTKARLRYFTEGLCVQAMHIGPFDEEPATIAKIDSYITENNMIYDIGTLLPDGNIRKHHEIYLSDPRKANPLKMQTILRHPVKH